jgi:hypothetical protein
VDAKHILERVASLKQEMRDLQDLGPVSEFLKPLTAFCASLLITKAKSDMLREFSGSEAAISLMRRFWTDWPPEAVTRRLEQRVRNSVPT